MRALDRLVEQHCRLAELESARQAGLHQTAVRPTGLPTVPAGFEVVEVSRPINGQLVVRVRRGNATCVGRGRTVQQAADNAVLVMLRFSPTLY